MRKVGQTILPMTIGYMCVCVCVLLKSNRQGVEDDIHHRANLWSLWDWRISLDCNSWFWNLNRWDRRVSFDCDSWFVHRVFLSCVVVVKMYCNIAESGCQPLFWKFLTCRVIDSVWLVHCIVDHPSPATAVDVMASPLELSEYGFFWFGELWEHRFFSVVLLLWRRIVSEWTLAVNP